MGEEVKMNDYEMEINGEDNCDYDGRREDCGGDDGDDEEHVHQWEVGLPSGDDLTPLSQMLIPADLASAFSISPEPSRTFHEVNRASRNTLSSLRSCSDDGAGGASSHALNFKCLSENQNGVVEGEDNNDHNNANNSTDLDGSDSQLRKMRKLGGDNINGNYIGTEAADADSSAGAGDARTLKRPRLVWTPQLHKRFVDVVAHLGIKNAVPKTIMQLMNVEGLTRENVASHLQKYRLYLKRMQQGDIGGEGGPPNSEQQLFDSCHEGTGGGGPGGGGGGGGSSASGGGNSNAQMGMPPIPMPYQMMPMPMQMPVYGGHQMMGNHHQYQHHGFDGNHPYNMMQQPRDWSANNSYQRHVDNN